MSIRFQWLFNLTKNGVRSGLENQLGRRIMFSNIVFMSLPVVYFIFILIDYKSYLRPVTSLNFDQFVVPIVILICIFCLWLNKKQYTSASRNIFLASWPLLLHIIPIQLMNAPSDYLVAFPIGLIFHAILIQLMFSHKLEAKQFWGWLIMNFIVLVFVPEFLSYFDAQHLLPNEVISNKYYTLDCVLYWLLFNLLTFCIILEMTNNIRKIHESNNMVGKQRDELNRLNENLEKIVLQRTQALEEQNAKLRNYAFYNAHLLRGPFCRIQGLINLQDIIKDSKEDQQLIRAKLDESIEELDTRIHEIQRIVQEEEEFDRLFNNKN